MAVAAQDEQVGVARGSAQNLRGAPLDRLGRDRDPGSARKSPDLVTEDPLHARCLVLADGRTTIAIAIVDSCMIPRDVCDAIKGEVEKRC